jgi:membrane-associated phospholipid phosphatase
VFGESKAKPEVPGFADLVTPLKDDFRRLFRRNHAGFAQLGLLGALTFAPWDANVKTAGWGDGTVHTVLKPGEFVGGAIFQSSAAFATYAVGRVTKSPRVARLGADLVRAQIVSQTVTQAVKFSTRRTRPDGTELSFPSGHTSSSFATATVLNAHFGPKVGIPAYAMASWVAASRVQMKRHHVTDVIIGATVGVLAGRAVTFGVGSDRFALSPLAVPGGAGVSIVRLNGR